VKRNAIYREQDLMPVLDVSSKKFFTPRLWQLNADDYADAFYEAFENADSFEDLPAWAQTAILEAEKHSPEVETVSVSR
jgi:hypothetical protein